MPNHKIPRKRKKSLGKGHSVCTCCELKYYKGNILTGFTIGQNKIGQKEEVCIDIPASEIPNLIRIATKVLKKDEEI